jgi:hypothetical protein
MGGVDAFLAQFFDRRDVPVFCWTPTRLLTLEIAWMRTVLGRRRIRDGRWEYYNG